MNIVFGNYGNETVALVQYCMQHNIPIEYVVTVDTAWAGKDFAGRVLACEKWIAARGVQTVRLSSKAGFAALMRQQANFPSTKFQWCAGFLKGLPFLDWLDETDPTNEGKILLPKYRQQSISLVDLAEIIEESEHYGEREVWHPMVSISKQELKSLITQTPIEWLAHRSLECEPCVNNSHADFERIAKTDIDKTQQLETELNKPMFAPESYSDNVGIEAVVRWVEKQDNTRSQGDENFSLGCGSPFACGS